MPFLMILAWILVVACGGVLVVWIAIAIRVQIMLASNPTVRRGLDLPAPQPDVGWPSLSVIIPAYNEQDMIERCVESLLAQRYDKLEIIFVLDRCTDETSTRLATFAESDSRIIVIENDSCPEDWAGKCNAARLGAERASGEWLLFTDADTQFDPDLCRASMAIAMTESLSLLSLLTTLTSEKRFERIVQPVASMNLVQMYPPGRLDRDAGARPFANGQFMLFERKRYETVGGHAAVKDDLLEDIAIARVIAKQGGRTGVLFADGMLTCTMYDSFEAFKEGWKRIYIEACKRKPGRLRKSGAKAIAAGLIAPLVQMAALGVAALIWNHDHSLALLLISLVAGGWFVQVTTLMRIYGLSGAPKLAAFGFPVGSVQVGRIMLEASSDLRAGRPIRWGGREYVLDPR